MNIYCSCILYAGRTIEIYGEKEVVELKNDQECSMLDDVMRL